MSETKLKPCPFCGERAETDFIPEHHSYQIECSDSIGCTARITRDSELGAIEAWNCRAALAAPAQAVSEPSREGQYAELPEHDATTVGLGCVWNRHSMRAFADATHALRASHGQAPAPGAPTDTPHAELRKTWREGQRWQARGGPTGQWLDTVPLWYPDQEYRRHPDDFDAAAPTQVGEYPELPPLQVRYDGLGHTTTMGYGVSQMRAYADATCAARGAAQAAPVDASVQRESQYNRGFRHGYNRRDAEVKGALA